VGGGENSDVLALRAFDIVGLRACVRIIVFTTIFITVFTTIFITVFTAGSTIALIAACDVTRQVDRHKCKLCV